jgi:phage FluMu protein gp41
MRGCDVLRRMGTGIGDDIMWKLIQQLRAERLARLAEEARRWSEMLAKDGIRFGDGDKG